MANAGNLITRLWLYLQFSLALSIKLDTQSGILQNLCRRSRICIAFAHSEDYSMNSSQEDISAQYAFARRVRALHGHENAIPFYETLLTSYPKDRSAASHIAASRSALQRQDRIFECRNDSNERKNDALKLHNLLKQSNFTAKDIHITFCGEDSDRTTQILKCSATGPVYIKPIVAGIFSKQMLPLNESQDNNQLRRCTIVDKITISRNCLINLFVLGFTGKRRILSSIASYDLPTTAM